MRTARIEALGAADLIRVSTAEHPRVGDREVLVRVTHTSVNHVDTFVRSGSWRTALAFPLTVGRDAVGVVERVGAAAGADLEPGQRVWTNSLGYAGRDGAAAELVSVEAARLYRVPDGIGSAEMAALCHPGATAHLALFRWGGLRLDDHVVVVGAGGNIGRVAVQLAVAAGARVTAVARAHHHADLRRLGAHVAVDLPAVRADGLDQPLDLVVDAAGDNDLTLWAEQARHGARIVLVAGMGSTATVPVGAVYLKSLHLTGFAISQMGEEELADAARGLCRAVERGLRPPDVVLRPLEEIAAAHADLEAGTVRGKQVIEVATPPVPATTTHHHPEEVPCT